MGREGGFAGAVVGFSVLVAVVVVDAGCEVLLLARFLDDEGESEAKAGAMTRGE
jgi:hypothetical protein